MVNDLKEDNFNMRLFDSQFVKYFQILDTDYNNYLVLYYCDSAAEYKDKESGLSLNATEVWKHKKSVLPNGSGENTLINIEFDDDKVETFDVHNDWV